MKPLKIQREIFARPEKELTRAEYDRLVRAAQSKRNERLALLLQTICAPCVPTAVDAFCRFPSCRFWWCSRWNVPASPPTLKGPSRWSSKCAQTGAGDCGETPCPAPHPRFYTDFSYPARCCFCPAVCRLRCEIPRRRLFSAPCKSKSGSCTALWAIIRCGFFPCSPPTPARPSPPPP